MLIALLPMFETVLPETEPFRVLTALAVEVLNALVKVEVAVAPLLAAMAPAEDADESPELLFWPEWSSWLELSVLVVVLLVVATLLLRSLLSLVFVVLVLRLLLSVFVVVLVFVLVLIERLLLSA